MASDTGLFESSSTSIRVGHVALPPLVSLATARPYALAVCSCGESPAPPPMRTCCPLAPSPSLRHVCADVGAFVCVQSVSLLVATRRAALTAPRRPPSAGRHRWSATRRTHTGTHSPTCTRGKGREKWRWRGVTVTHARTTSLPPSWLPFSIFSLSCSRARFPHVVGAARAAESQRGAARKDATARRSEAAEEERAAGRKHHRRRTDQRRRRTARCRRHRTKQAVHPPLTRRTGRTCLAPVVPRTSGPCSSCEVAKVS